MKKESRVLALLAIVICSNIFLLSSNNLLLSNNAAQEDIIDSDVPETSNGATDSRVIVYFNSSTSYNTSVISNFTYHGGIVSKEWNNTFANISVFAGTIPTANITLFEGNISDAIVDIDEVIETQMNYATVQTGAVNTTWQQNGFMGSINSSIAVLDTGVNPNHIFFPDGYNSTNLTGTVVGWEDFVNQGVNPSDDNGHGTFISSVIAGTGTTNSTNSTIMSFYGNYSHADLFPGKTTPDNYSINLCSFNASQENSNIVLNSSWHSIQGINAGFWFDLYFNNTKVNSSLLANDDTFYQMIHSVSGDDGIYDLYLVYYFDDEGAFPVFTFTTNLSFIPENYTTNFKSFTGMANGSKIVSYKIVNQTGIGYTSDLIDALVSVMQNKSKYHIVSVCLSVASFGNDANAINGVIDEVISNGTLVVIAAGNRGPFGGSDPLNILGTNKNAIVVGAINDKDQVTSYSSMGRDVGGNVIKPDIVAPGGSVVEGSRSIISADFDTNKTTAAYGTSIATAIVSAAINILIEAKWGDWTEWEKLNLTEWVKIIKATVLMTASETDQDREDDPLTGYDESDDSPTSYFPSVDTKDVHEGYGKLNTQAAIDALTKYIVLNETVNGTLTSSKDDPLGTHVFARRIVLNHTITYIFNITVEDAGAELYMYLYSNESDQYGEPEMLAASRTPFTPLASHFYFTPNENQTETIIVVKAIDGISFFEVNVTNSSNQESPILSLPEISTLQGGITRNTTVMSVREYENGYIPDDNYTIDNYLFFINYTDNDTTNAPPQIVYVSIDGTNYTMTRAYLWETNFSEGVVYISEEITLWNEGTYNYAFYASDGLHSARYPLSGDLSISVVFPTGSQQIPYSVGFFTYPVLPANWQETGTGWNSLIQSNIDSPDDRRRYTDTTLIWGSAYFGTYHFFPRNYTYQPAVLYPFGEYPNGSLYSPLFNLTGLSDNTHPILKIGNRVSINAGDHIYLYITINWTTDILLRDYGAGNGEEREWTLDKYNLSQYKGNYVQFRFESSLNNLFDPVKNRGFMLDFFAIENYTNNNIPKIENPKEGELILNRLEPSGGGFKYQKFTFTMDYYDADNNYPDYVYLEIDNPSGVKTNYTMINTYGDWEANTTTLGGTSYYGIQFSKSLVLGSVVNRTYRFWISDGETIVNTSWYNEDDSEITFTNPTPKEFNVEINDKDIAYDFSNTDMSDYFIAGYPAPQDYTAWLPSDNTWHPMNLAGDDVLYAGIGDISYTLEDFGYDPNWNAELLTYPLYVEGEYDVYLSFGHNISLDLEWPWTSTAASDKCDVSISTNYGDSWTLLPGQEYDYDDNGNTAGVMVDISDYKEQVVMIRFRLTSGPDSWIKQLGWFVYDISIGYDKSSDFIDPTVLITSPTTLSTVSSIVTISALLNDNIAIDESRTTIYITSETIDDSISDAYFSYDNTTGILTYEWDTTQYTDGAYEITVVVYDEEGNRVETSIFISLDNGFLDVNKWWPWLLLILIIIIAVISMYLFMEKKGKYMIDKRREQKIEKVRTSHLNLEEAKSKIQMISPETELARPHTLYCKFCKSWYSSREFDIMCPQCDHDQIFAAYNCTSCNKWYYKENPGEDYYCKKCSGVRLIRQEREVVEGILEQEGKIVRDYVFKKDQKGYSILDL